ncbi:MAG TPA: T9SS type A sorting domain-containing protein [Bacteroidia bacterium]|jgi:hypothetical protein|nr:T9SS type A sorting domain-containing protein [Bacteroidia bacterium]
MKKYFTLIFISLLALNTSKAQSWSWAEGGQKPNGKYAGQENTIAEDLNGDSFMLGTFGDTLSFGGNAIISNSMYSNTFLVKYNSSGSPLWVKAMFITSKSFAEAGSVVTDALGNVFMSGTFNDSIKFGSLWLTDTFSINTSYLVKYNSSGKLLWAKQFNIANNGNSLIDGGALVTDNIGNVYMTGAFIGQAFCGKDTIRCNYATFYLCKFDSSGNLIWLKQAIGNGIAASSGHSISMDSHNNLYIIGNFYSGTVSFSGYNINDIGNGDLTFIAKYDSAGHPLWVNQTTGTHNTSSDGWAIITDPNGNSYISGQFVDSISFGGHYLYNSSNNLGAFIVKYDSNGKVKWAAQSNMDSANGSWVGYSLSIDKKEHVYLSGGGSDSVLRFGSFTLKGKISTSAAFLIQFDSSGNAICGSIIPNTTPYSNVISDSSGSNIYWASAIYRDSLVFGTDTIETDTLSYLGAFIAKWVPCGAPSGVKRLSDKYSVNIYPNPSKGITTIQLSGVNCQSSIEIYNMLGEKIYTSKLNPTNTQINLSNNPNGIYLYRLLTETGGLISTGKIVIQK